MKSLSISFSLLFGISGFTQKHLYVDAELQLVSPKSGIIIKEKGRYYSLSFDAKIKNAIFSCDQIKKEIASQEFEALYNDAHNIINTAIRDDYDFEKLDRIKLTRVESNDRYDIFRMNQDYLACFKYTDQKYCELEEYLPFISVHFGNSKTVLITFGEEQSCVIALKDNFKIVTFNDDVKEFSQKGAKPNNEAFYKLSERFQTDDLYTLDTLLDKKLTIKNIFGNTKFSKVYDSIKMGTITQCYGPGGLDLYNQQFKKLNSEKVKAFKIRRGYIELIQGNTLSVIGFDGKKKKAPPFYGYVSMEESFQNNYRATISKSREKFRFLASISSKDTVSAPMINTGDISNFYFENNMTSSNQEDNSDVRISIIRHSMDKFFSYIIVYYKHKNGKYGISYLGNFLDPIFARENYFDEFQNATKIEFRTGLLFVKKNNLSCYSIGESPVWYKSLETFKGGFARYKSIRGQEGWLDRTGREYPDD